MSTTPKRDCDAAFDRMHAERDEARAYYLRCAQAIGVVYEADGINPHPGPIEEVEHHIREAARKSGDLAEARAEVERMRARYHPMQHVEMVGEVARFRANAIVRWLVDDRDAHGHETLNDIAYRVDFRREDHEQLAQLIGYSVSGAGDLDYVDDETLAIADAAVEALTSRGEEG